MPPSVSAGSDQAVTLPAPANLGGAASDDGLPNPPGTLATLWSTVSGPGAVAFGDPASPATTAAFAAPGTYVLRLSASDGALASSDDVTVVVNPAGGGGSLSASGSTSPPASVDLSAEGTADWAHWGAASATSFNHKSGVAQQISNYARVGGGTVKRYTNNPVLFGWSGGTPTASASGVNAGLWVVGLNNGFRVTVPADAAAVRTLKIYVGVCFTRGRLEATLSDGSAPAYADTSVVDAAATTDAVYTLTFRAASPGQTLTVTWTEVETFSTFGNVTLQAATLF